MKAIFSFLFVLITCLCNAQVVDLVGNVIVDNVDEDYNKSGIHIINQRTKELYTTTSDGSFKMKVQLNDELLFKSDFTQNRTIKIISSILIKGFINVHLDLEVIDLAEAKLNPLKKNLKDNISKEKSNQEKMYEIIGFNEEFKLDMIKYRLALSYLKKYNGNISYNNVLKLKEDFTDDAKNYRPEIRKEKAATIRMEEILAIKSFFTENYFSEYLSIPFNRIIDFIAYCYDMHQFKKLYQAQKFDDMFYHFESEAANFISLIQS